MTLEERRAQTREYYRAHKEQILFANLKYARKLQAVGGEKGFINCKDCRTCDKMDCRHNKNKPEEKVID